MARYSIHPADSGGHYHNIKFYKDRRQTFEHIKEQQRLKKLKKKRRK
ncbi:TPA: hypothetical protein U1137_001968 [Streptococcus suis]|nr:hypothetical protein [Streptococcus suis]MBM0194469.1 hypothetical protein [Streptococcus suis]MBM7316092.1 hypothetical protein [Streptococcus suis]MCB2963157.1 hypothetical protein [Streptococcus suis]MCK4070987.1 hypothetical protein [Streptococcus suis]NQK30019.1 hypothetical protein [Streptococcus suis]